MPRCSPPLPSQLGNEARVLIVGGWFIAEAIILGLPIILASRLIIIVIMRRILGVTIAVRLAGEVPGRKGRILRIVSLNDFSAFFVRVLLSFFFLFFLLFFFFSFLKHLSAVREQTALRWGSTFRWARTSILALQHSP